MNKKCVYAFQTWIIRKKIVWKVRGSWKLKLNGPSAAVIKYCGTVNAKAMTKASMLSSLETSNLQSIHRVHWNFGLGWWSQWRFKHIWEKDASRVFSTLKTVSAFACWNINSRLVEGGKTLVDESKQLFDDKRLQTRTGWSLNRAVFEKFEPQMSSSKYLLLICEFLIEKRVVTVFQSSVWNLLASGNLNDCSF